MKLDEEVKIIFKNHEGKTAEIVVTIKQLLENTIDDFNEWLEDTKPCTSANCNNESQNFCDCDSAFDGYEIVEVLVQPTDTNLDLAQDLIETDTAYWDEEWKS